MERWERMYQVFELLDYNDNMTVKKLSDELDIDVKLADFLLRHYNKNGYLTRKKDFTFKYTYRLSDKGKNQLDNFLRNNEYLNYLELIV